MTCLKRRSFVNELYDTLEMDFPAQAKSRDLLNKIFIEEESVESIMMDTKYVFKDFVEHIKRQREAHLEKIEGESVILQDIDIELVKTKYPNKISYDLNAKTHNNVISACSVEVIGRSTYIVLNNEPHEIETTEDLKIIIKTSFKTVGKILNNKENY